MIEILNKEICFYVFYIPNIYLRCMFGHAPPYVSLQLNIVLDKYFPFPK